MGESADRPSARRPASWLRGSRIFAACSSSSPCSRAGQVIVAAKVMLTEDVSADQAVREINAFEAALRRGTRR